MTGETELNRTNKINITINNKRNLKVRSSIVSPKTIKRIINTKGDSAVSHHYWREEDKQCVNEIIKVDSPSVLLLKNKMLTLKSQGQLPVSKLLCSKAKTAMILPNLKSVSLVSIGIMQWQLEYFFE